MRRILLAMMLAIAVSRVVKSQEATGPVAEGVAKEVMQLEREKAQCLLSTAKGSNNCADWIQKYYADEDLDITSFGGGPRRRSKAVVMEEIRSGKRKLLAFDQTNKVTNVYTATVGGKAGDGTTAVVTYIAHGTSETNGKRSDFNEYCIDVWTKQGGQWFLVLMNTRTAY